MWQRLGKAAPARLLEQRPELGSPAMKARLSDDALKRFLQRRE